jgi:hypothetical protein
VTLKKLMKIEKEVGNDLRTKPRMGYSGKNDSNKKVVIRVIMVMAAVVRH